MTPADRLQRHARALTFLLGMCVYVSISLGVTAARVEELERRRRRHLHELDALVDGLEADVARLHADRASWQRLSVEERRTVLAELGELAEPEPPSRAAAAAELDALGLTELSRATAAVQRHELARAAAAHADQVLGLADEAWQPDPSTILECDGCASPVACQAERHCRAQLPAPTITPTGEQLPEADA